MLINLSNHNSKFWTKNQLIEGIKNYGSIVDLEFPYIVPEMGLAEVEALAEEYREIIEQLLNTTMESRNAVHLAGEFTFCYVLLNKLRAMNIEAVASVTERITEYKDNKKISEFVFKGFRPYYLTDKR